MRIFISYRREDSAGYTGRLFDHLAAHFGEDKIFMDIDTIKPGQDFVEAIETAISQCAALVAVIGKQWFSITDEEGQRRLENPYDFVRLEISQALERNILVVPVLVENTKMPRPDELPNDLKKLARRSALPISHERFRYDVGRLIEVLAELDKTVAAKVADDVDMAGLWSDTQVEVFFKQKNQRVVGYYILPDSSKGIYSGELIGYVFEFKWQLLDTPALNGHGRVIVSGNRKKISGHYWTGAVEDAPASISFEWKGSVVPAWLTEPDLHQIDALLASSG